jgi:hypothetical protein
VARPDPVARPVGTHPPRRSRFRRARAAALGTVAGLLLAGCAGIPQSGPVVIGRSVGEAPRALLRISGAGPKAGDTPEEIVRGFLRATADITDDHSVARLFLAGARQESWRADSSVVIYAGDSQLTTSAAPVTPTSAGATSTASGTTAPGQPSRGPTGDPSSAPTAGASTSVPAPPAPAAPSTTRPASAATSGPVVAPSDLVASGSTTTAPADGARVVVTVQVPVTARVDGDGVYAVSPPGNVERRVFGLVVAQGQWRIDTLEDGSMLSRADFDTTYSDLPVYFPDPTGGWLVPDVRWFPVGGATPTALVTAVLGGPSPWLASAVTTGAPVGTRLTASSVPIRQGTAVVDLTSAVRQADPVHRQMLRAQLVNTLAVLPQISQTPVDSVTITVESKTFDVPRASDLAATAGRPGEPSPRLLPDPVVDDSPLVVDKGRLMRLSGRQLAAVDGLTALNSPAVTWPAIATDGSAYAALVGGNRLDHAVVGGKAVPLVSGLGELTPPSFDPLGWVWTAAASGLAVRAGRPDRGAVAVATTGWPAGMRVTSLRISRDGARALVSGQRGTGGLLFVCAVERDRAQVPVRLGPPQTLLPDLTVARSAAWLDQRRVVVLGRRGSGPEQPWKVEIGGDAEAVPAVPGAQGLTAGNGEIYAALPDGVARLAVTIWEKVTTARWPAMPG